MGDTKSQKTEQKAVHATVVPESLSGFNGLSQPEQAKKTRHRKKLLEQRK